VSLTGNLGKIASAKVAGCLNRVSVPKFQVWRSGSINLNLRKRSIPICNENEELMKPKKTL